MDRILAPHLSAGEPGLPSDQTDSGLFYGGHSGHAGESTDASPLQAATTISAAEGRDSPSTKPFRLPSAPNLTLSEGSGTTWD